MICKKMRKIPIFLVFFSLLLTACFEPLISEFDETDVTYFNIPSGKGAFYLQIDDVKARAIMPEFNINQFEKFILDFINTATDDIIETVECASGELNDPVFLFPGNYKLRISAFTSLTSGDPAAEGISDPFDINIGNTTLGNVELDVFINDGGTGTFSWKLTIPENFNLEVKNIVINRLNNAPMDPINLTFNTVNGVDVSEGFIDLLSGYYRMILTLEKDALTEPVIIRQFLHIYSDMESKFEREFNDSHFGIVETPIPDGTANNPFIISTVAELRDMGRGFNGWTASAHYKLDGSFTLNSNWTPIPTTFTGSLNGNGHYIDLGNNIHTFTTSFGLFATIGNGGEVRNLEIRGTINRSISQTGTVNFGVVTATNNGTIRNVVSNVNFTVNNTLSGQTNVGGIAGQNTNGGTITNSYSIGNVSGSSSNMANIGGIAGLNNGGTITFCWVGGTIENTSTSVNGNAGSIAGQIQSGFIENCAAIESIVKTNIATNNAGRIVGVRLGGTINNNYTYNVYLEKAGDEYTPPTTTITSADGATIDNLNDIQSTLESAGWTINSSKSAASLTSPWWWNVDRPRLWFEN